MIGDAERMIATSVNGRTVRRAVAPHRSLAEFLREDLGLTGTKTSCDLQVCGACTVLVDDHPVSGCTYLAVDADGRTVRTIEGLETNAELHPLQQAFVDRFAFQCGFCTPGFLMMAVALLEENPEPTEAEVIDYLSGNLCRCTGYRPIVDAVLDAARRLKEPAQ